jgi:hypothetical protein
MVGSSFGTFIDAVMEAGSLSRDDVSALQGILPDGVTTRDEADMLIALDRALDRKDPSWASYLVPALVEFVLRNSRPRGCVDRLTAEWLTTSLGCGAGPSDNAVAIAFSVVRASELSHEILVAFVMRWARGRTLGLPEREGALLPA